MVYTVCRKYFVSHNGDVSPQSYTPAVNDVYLNNCPYKSTHLLHKMKILTIPNTYNPPILE